MHTENTWECEKSMGMRRKKRRSYEKSERPWTLTEKKEGTHINAHVSVEDWGVNVTSSSLVMWKLLLQNASCGAPDNLGILFCLFPPHHATAKGQQQPFLISVITSEGRGGKKIQTDQMYGNPSTQTQISFDWLSLLASDSADAH